MGFILLIFKKIIKERSWLVGQDWGPLDTLRESKPYRK